MPPTRPSPNSIPLGERQATPTVPPPGPGPRVRPGRRSACGWCRLAKAGCLFADEGEGCERCAKQGLRCSGPERTATGGQPSRARNLRGAVIARLKTTLASPGPTSSQAGLEAATLSAGLLHSLVQLTHQRYPPHVLRLLTGSTAGQDEGTLWHRTTALGPAAEVRCLALAALGVQLSSHSAITGPARSPTDLATARHSAFVRLATRALTAATELNLFRPAHPTPATFTATRLLLYALRDVPDSSALVAEHQDALLAQRVRVADGGQDGADVAGRLHVNWALADLVGGRLVGTGVLMEHFGLGREELAEDVGELKRAGRELEVEEGGREWTVAEGLALREVALRVAFWALRGLMVARRKVENGDATLAKVLPDLIRACSLLYLVESTWAALSTHFSIFNSGDALAAWIGRAAVIPRRLAGIDLYAHETLAQLAAAQAEPLSLETQILLRAVKLRAARALKMLALGAASDATSAATSGPGMGWLGATWVRLPSGLTGVELAVQAAREGVSGTGELGEVGMTVADLERLAGGLAERAGLGGWARKQLGALERGLEELKVEECSQCGARVGGDAAVSCAESFGEAAVAKRMVDEAVGGLLAC